MLFSGKKHYAVAVLEIMSEKLQSFIRRNEYSPAILFLC